MRYLIILIVIFSILSCNQNEIKKTNTIQKIDLKVIKKLNNNSRKSDYCLKIDTLPKSNYYQTNLDTFLMRHQLVINSNQQINQLFHKSTKDFITKNEINFMHYMYNGKAYSVKEIKISNDITAIFYAYLFDSEIIQPRIEIQTFNKKQKNIDNLIIASTFSSECAGYREFCIDENTIEVFDYYYCYEYNQQHKGVYKFKINDNGVFVKQEL